MKKRNFESIRYAAALILILVLTGLSPQVLAAVIPGEDRVYRETVHTVQLFKTGFELSAPLIQLKSAETLTLGFDDLSDDLMKFQYTIIHCEADWSVSPDISQMDYISGLYEDNISEYAYSFNAVPSYVHYFLVFPNERMAPALSGNYILAVYDDSPDKLVLTRRFMVSEGAPVFITARVVRPARTELNETGQQIDFEVDLGQFSVSDVQHELKIYVQQNDRIDNMLKDIKPRFVRGSILDFRYDDKNVFNGGNEYRPVDIKSLKYQTDRVLKIYSDSGYTQVALLNEPNRSFKHYVTEKDINGRFIVKSEDNVTNSDTQSDYAWVYFFYPASLVTIGDYFLLGAMTDWQMDDRSRMNYDFNRRGYAKRLFLKQGYYDYLIVFREKGKTIGDESYVEGSHWETENQYTIYIYYRPVGGTYDRLLQSTNFSSQE